MSVYDVPSGRFPTQNQGEITYVKNGDIYTGEVAKNILIESASDLSLLTGFTPGSLAHTAGWEYIWELNTSGTWVPFA